MRRYEGIITKDNYQSQTRDTILNDSYINRSQTRDTILKPAIADISDLLLATTIINNNSKNKTKKKKKNNDPPPKKYYRCPGSFSSPMYFSDDPNAVCPHCSGKMGHDGLYYVSPPGQVPSTEGTGVVKGMVSYMVLDDLVVRPMSSVSCIALLNELNVNDVCALQEKVVVLGMAEAVKLLKASLETRNVLTHVFLKASQEHEEEQPVRGKRRRQWVGSIPTQEAGPSMSTSSVEEVKPDGRARRASTSRPQRKGVKN